MDQCACLGDAWFEELQLMKFAWRSDIVDLAAWNLQDAEEVDIIEYETLFQADVEEAEWDKEMGVDT